MRQDHERTAERTALRQQVTDLFFEERDGVYRSLIVAGLDAGKAEEAAQEAFLRFYAALKKGAAIENPRGWVYRVAHNLAMDVLTAQARESNLSVLMIETLPARNGDVEDVLIQEQGLKNLRAAIGRLSRQQRLCLELRAQGLRYQDIAEVLHIRTSTVGEFLRRAVQQLKRYCA